MLRSLKSIFAYFMVPIYSGQFASELHGPDVRNLHLSTMDRLPTFSDKRIFGLIFDIGEIWTEAALLQLILQEV
ncbi:hypothetical protein [Sphingobacterium multivorum]|uniref:hypothetical protein n=1 Tax=Sphingobacterium multivorum TaxID=28454 RepID=UPI0028B01B42|nr:hypothetical protein [Sphingobacterium multivorum]